MLSIPFEVDPRHAFVWSGGPERRCTGRGARSLILYGLRGVGKTVLLNRIRIDAEAREIVAVNMEAPEDRSLPALLAPALRAALIRLDRRQAATAGVRKALRALAGFVSALKMKHDDIEVALDVDPEKGLADSGDLNNDLSELLIAVGKAAAEKKTAIVLFIDELQYVPEEQFAALITALHAANQAQLPVTMLAAGLPQLLGARPVGPNPTQNDYLNSFPSTNSIRKRQSLRCACLLRKTASNSDVRRST